MRRSRDPRHSGEQLTAPDRVDPPPQGPPPAIRARSAPRPGTDGPSNRFTRKHRQRPQRQREGDRRRPVATTRQISRAHDHHRPAPNAAIPPHPDRTGRWLERRVRGTPDLSLHETVPVKPQAPARNPARPVAARTSRGAHRVHRRNAMVPELEIDLRLEDASIAFRAPRSFWRGGCCRTPAPLSIIDSQRPRSPPRWPIGRNRASREKRARTVRDDQNSLAAEPSQSLRESGLRYINKGAH